VSILNGGQARQIRVLLDAQKLTSHNFTVLDVREALQRENIEAPGGRMITGPQELGLRTLGRVTSADQFSEIVVGTRAGIPVRIRDVAQVEDGAQELRTWSALFRGGKPGQDVVSVQILRQSGANTVRVADDVRKQIESLRGQLPSGRSTAGDSRHFGFHPRLRALASGAPDPGQHSGECGGLDFHPQLAGGADRGGCDSRLRSLASFTLMRGMDFLPEQH